MSWRRIGDWDYAWSWEGEDLVFSALKQPALNIAMVVQRPVTGRIERRIKRAEIVAWFETYLKVQEVFISEEEARTRGVT